ncbi:50S ribosomal protein L18e [Candidatus Woesearchaeota archaeon]|nr:50S ribosomal protein L18e [Candidatus Woesearchaeota archaeon]
MKHTGPTNPKLKALIIELQRLGRKENVKLWKRVALDLNKPTRIRREANLDKINKYTKDDEIALIPGKVLSTGELKKKIKIAAFKFSERAKEKINKAGKALTIEQLMKENPKGKKIRIIG